MGDGEKPAKDVDSTGDDAPLKDDAPVEKAGSSKGDEAKDEPKKGKAKRKRAAAVEAPRPAFAADYPRVPQLDHLVAAFEAGNYAYVRAEAPKLADSTEDANVRDAARELAARLRPDPLAIGLLAFTALLLAFLGTWWAIQGKAPASQPRPAPTIEIVR